MDTDDLSVDAQDASEKEDFSKYCRDVIDFPKKGVVFKDITTLIQDGTLFKRAIDEIAAHFSSLQVDVVACIDARGFIIGSALAYKLGSGVVLVRKKGKLPWRVHRKTYDLEYGQDTLEIHQDAVNPGQKVLIVDDVLATGGTAAAVVSLIKEMEGEIVGVAFLMELKELKGREKLKGIPLYSLMEC
jgi:adenine phosphoribosyltransferase